MRKIAIFGQAAFGRDVLLRVLAAGHEVVAVYVPPDPPGRGRPDPLAEEAQAKGLRLLRHARFRRQGRAIDALVTEYLGLGAELNLMPFTTVILPPQIVEAPPLGSLCFHPSLLPRFRGGSAIPWQVILGERESGVTVFRPDAGVDTGPIVVQKGGVEICDTETAASLYFDKLYPLGLEAIDEAVHAVDTGAAVLRPQDERCASFQGLVDDTAARIDWTKDARTIDRLVRGCDPQPGAHALRGGVPVRLFDARLLPGRPEHASGTVLACDGDALVVAAGTGRLQIGRVRVGDGKKLAAAQSGLAPGDVLA
ncbi:MAG: methionyl-tRNA formyltransferase [Deltaproteobacteria bacterium]|nr:methionyl-tRNA formyltransferase [Deltaproteobacteria bacterium]